MALIEQKQQHFGKKLFEISRLVFNSGGGEHNSLLKESKTKNKKSSKFTNFVYTIKIN